MIEGTVLRGLPFEGADRIVSVRATELSTGHAEDIPLGLVRKWEEASNAFESLGAYVDYRAFVRLGTRGTGVYPAASVTPGFFKVLGIQPVIGPGLGTANKGGSEAQLAYLSYQAWKRDFGGDPEIIGAELQVNDQPTTIVGVLPKGFSFPSGQEIWIQLPLDGPQAERFANLPVIPIGRVAKGTPIEAGREDLQSITANDEVDHSFLPKQTSLVVEPFIVARTDPRLRSSVLPMILGMCTVLILACANVSNLLLARAATGRHAVAIKAALGASRAEAAVTMLFESLALSSAGALAALPLTYLGVEAFNRFMTPSRVLHASWVAVTVDPRVLAFIVVASVVSGLLISVLPAIDRSTRKPGEALGNSARSLGLGRLGFWNRSLMLLELAVTAGLLFVAGLLAKNLVQLRTVDTGVKPAAVVSAKVSILPAHDVDEAGSEQFFASLARRVEALPGVQSAAYVSSVPTEGTFWREVSIEGHRDPVRVRWQVVSSGAFGTLGVPFFAGRDFRALGSGQSQNEVIVNRSFAKQFLTGRGIGDQLRLADAAAGKSTMTVVGVVGDFLLEPPGEASNAPAIFTSTSHDPRKSMELVVRGGAGFSVPTKALCREAIRTRPEAACFDVRHLEDVLSRRVWIYDALATLFAGLGCLALILGAAGAFGVMSFLASNSRQEIGLRFALGATRRDIEGLVLRQFATPALIGISVGLVAGVSSARLLSSLLPGVGAWDPLILTWTVLILAGPTLLAAFGPARRAAKVDPMSSLRME